MTTHWSLMHIASELGLEVSARGLGGDDPSLEVPISSWTPDSRECIPGSLFIAVDGGESHALDAAARGAIGAIANTAIPGVPTVVVPDVHCALAQLANTYRACLAASVVAVAGSAGKTSTKDLFAAASEPLGSVHASKRSFNNEIGVPITVLECPRTADVLIAECGERRFGDLRHLGNILQPNGMLLTSIGHAHQEFLGGPNGVVSEMAELLAATSGWLALTSRDFDLMRSRIPSAVTELQVGIDPKDPAPAAVLQLESIDLDETGRACGSGQSQWGSFEFSLQLTGRHQAENAALALAAALHLGVPIDRAVAGLGVVRANVGRGELHVRNDGLRVLDDTYNANPESTTAALRVVAAMPAKRRCAVIGEMRELGSNASDAHRSVGIAAAQLGIDVFVPLGAYRNDLKSGFESIRGAGSAVDTTMDTTWKELRTQFDSDDVVLVKASRAAHLEALVAILLEDVR